MDWEKVTQFIIDYSLYLMLIKQRELKMKPMYKSVKFSGTLNVYKDLLGQTTYTEESLDNLISTLLEGDFKKDIFADPNITSPFFVDFLEIQDIDKNWSE